MIELTVKELEKFDGTGGNKCYVAYRGSIYDVTESPLFIEGMHFEHFAGSDLTEAIADSPHADDVFAEFPVIGTLIK